MTLLIEGTIYNRPTAMRAAPRRPPAAGMATALAAPVAVAADEALLAPELAPEFAALLAELAREEPALLRLLILELRDDAAELVAVARSEVREAPREVKLLNADDCAVAMLPKSELA